MAPKIALRTMMFPWECETMVIACEAVSAATYISPVTCLVVGPIIHRRKRCDLSLCQLGLRFLEHLLNEEMLIPVQFHVTI
jgi:hypothetical protein